MSIQNSINQALGIGALVSHAAGVEAKEDANIAEQRFDILKSEGDKAYSNLTKVAKEAEKAGIRAEDDDDDGGLVRLTLDDQGKQAIKEMSGKGIIGNKKLKKKYDFYSENEADYRLDVNSKMRRIKDQIDQMKEANKVADAKRKAKIEQMKPYENFSPEAQRIIAKELGVE